MNYIYISSSSHNLLYKSYQVFHLQDIMADFEPNRRNFWNCHSCPRRMCGFTVDDDPWLGFGMEEGTGFEDEWARYRENNGNLINGTWRPQQIIT
jgi:hypothetical protein